MIYHIYKGIRKLSLKLLNVIDNNEYQHTAKCMELSVGSRGYHSLCSLMEFAGIVHYSCCQLTPGDRKKA